MKQSGGPDGGLAMALMHPDPTTTETGIFFRAVSGDTRDQG
jgi:hypothetical protein